MKRESSEKLTRIMAKVRGIDNVHITLANFMRIFARNKLLE